MTKKRQNGSVDLVNLTGEIRAANLDHGTFVLRLPDGTRVSGTFSTMQESRPFWKWVVELGESIPAEEWDSVPTDLGKNLDHYLYGSTKVKE